MISLKNKLLVTQLLIQLCLLGAFCSALYLYTQHVLEKQLEQDLRRDLADITSQLRWHEEDDGLSFELAGNVDSTVLYTIKTPHDILVFSSENIPPDELLTGDSASPEADTIRSTKSYKTLSSVVTKEGPTNGWKIFIAKSRTPVTEAQAIILKGCIICGSLLLLCNLLAIYWNTHHALKPLSQMGNQVEVLDVKKIDTKFQPENYPPELSDIAHKLNELIDRIAQTISRESRFASSAAHELRTPIAELRSIVEVGLMTIRDTEEDLKEHFTDALDVINRMQKLMDSLLSLSKNDNDHPLQLETLDLNKIIAPQLLEEESLHCSDQPLIIEADPSILQSLLSNLINNARTYGEGPLEVHTHDQWIEFRNPCFSLNKEDMDKVLEPFWTQSHARTSGSGTGLGLSMVQSYCKLHHWNFSVHLEDQTFIARIDF